MPIEMDNINSKLGKLDEILDKFDEKIKGLNSIMDLPSATGLIGKCQDDMIGILNLLIQEKIQFWLEGHTLLAVCRTGNLLPWETSFEVGMLAEDWISFIESKLLKQNKLKIENETTITSFEEQTMGALKPQIKVRRWLKDNGIMRPFDNSIDEVDEAIIWPLTDGQLQNQTFPIPSRSWKLLELQFGKDWKKAL